MKKTFLGIVLLSLILGISCTKKRDTSVTDFVNPFIGTDGKGYCSPGAAIPFGAIQFNPNTSNDSDKQGYRYNDSVITAFSLVQPTTDGLSINLLPSTREPHPGENTIHFIRSCYAPFSHQDEQAEPGYYSVTFKNGIKTESAVTERCGMQYYQFPTNASYGLIIDLITSKDEGFSQETAIKKVDNRSIQGYRKYMKNNQLKKIHFYIQFSQDVNVWAGKDTFALLDNGQRIVSPQSSAWIDFGKTTNKVIAKASISTANGDGAIANLNKEIPHWSFDKVKRDAKQQWRRTLSRIKIDLQDPETAKTFYTALYHAYLTPSVISDIHGNYTGADGEVHTIGKAIQYGLVPLQYTAMTQYPLLALTQREKVSEIIQSLLMFYDQTGTLPLGVDPQKAIGNPAVSMIAGAYTRGIRNYNTEKAYEAIKMTLSNTLSEHDHSPEPTEHVIPKSLLADAYDNWCAAQMAKALNQEDDYLSYIQSAQNYDQQFDSIDSFFQENIAYHSSNIPDEKIRKATWFIPHETEKSIRVQNADLSFCAQLDSLFSNDYYDHSVVSSQHTAYLFDIAGVPDKTQYYIDKIRKFYTNTPDGLPGNDQYGQTSGWFVFSAIGFYPLNPADGKYRLGTPLFNKTIIKLGQDRRFVIRANRENDQYIYVKEILLNGDPLNRPWITHEEIIRGGELEFILSDQAPKKS